jgi:hypothetical protein
VIGVGFAFAEGAVVVWHSCSLLAPNLVRIAQRNVADWFDQVSLPPPIRPTSVTSVSSSIGKIRDSR